MDKLSLSLIHFGHRRALALASLVVTVLLSASLGVGTAHAGPTMLITTTFDVISSTDGLCSLREAVIAANTNTASGAGAGECPAGDDDSTDTITLMYGAIYSLTLTGSQGGPLSIYDNTVYPDPDVIITVMDNGTATISQDASPDTRVMYIDRDWGSEDAPKVEVTGVTFTGGDVSAYSDVESWGSSIYNRGSLTFTNSVVTANKAGSGGGIYNLGSVTLNQSTVSNNQALAYVNTSGGGIYSGTEAHLTVKDSEISGNTAQYGGGILNENGLDVTGSRIVNNAADYLGSAIYQSSNYMTVTGSCLVGNADNAVFNSYSTTADATGNWWGASNGPGGVGPGFGDEVDTNVDFTGFLTAPILGCGLEPGVVQLVANPGIENDTNNDGVPNAWTGTALEIPPDGRVCGASNCYMNFAGMGIDKKLAQTITASGASGDQFIFTAKSLAVNVPASGGIYWASVQITYASSTTQTWQLNFSTGSHS